MQHLGKTVKFTFTFNPTKGLEWPTISILVNNFQIHTQTITPENFTVTVHAYMHRCPNNISIYYFNKHERETVIKDNQIVADQSLELVSVHADDILLESWFWTEHCYYPQYFVGYKKQAPDAPSTLRSQLIWHFPGRYMIMELPNSDQFWNWYQKTRTEKILSTLVDPTGQLKENHQPIDDEDKKTIQAIKDIINV